MLTFLEAVSVADECFLYEVLLWVACARVPEATYDPDGSEGEGRFFESPEEADFPDREFIYPHESQLLGIGVDPSYEEADGGDYHLPPDHYDKLLSLPDLDETVRRQFETEREEAAAHQAKVDRWLGEFDLATGLSQTKVFTALREGRLSARGYPVKRNDDKKDEFTDSQETSQEPTTIPPDFWQLRGIQWIDSEAVSPRGHYRGIHCSAAQMFTLFPPIADRQISGLQQTGSTLFISDDDERGAVAKASVKPRGRPPLPWHFFHIEVTSRLLSEGLPNKKEAAIAELQDWLLDTHGIQASRSAIGDKLTPYYERFVRKDRK